MYIAYVGVSEFSVLIDCFFLFFVFSALNIIIYVVAVFRKQRAKIASVIKICDIENQYFNSNCIGRKIKNENLINNHRVYFSN